MLQIDVNCSEVDQNHLSFHRHHRQSCRCHQHAWIPKTSLPPASATWNGTTTKRTVVCDGDVDVATVILLITCGVRKYTFRNDNLSSAMASTLGCETWQRIVPMQVHGTWEESEEGGRLRPRTSKEESSGIRRATTRMILAKLKLHP